MIESYEQYGLLFRPSLPWQEPTFGFPPEAMGDCLSLSGDEAEDIDALFTVGALLKERKRWPDVLQEKYKQFIAKTRLEYWWSKKRWKWSKDKDGKTDRLRKYRPQTDMSRDPFVYYFAGCVRLGVRDWIKDVTVPFLTNRPTLHAWRRYLISQTEKDKKRYVFWEELFLKLPRREYAANLVRARVTAAGCPEILENLPPPKPNKI